MKPTSPVRLNSLGVVVTRPAPQARRLAGLIESAGGQAIEFPTICIQATASDAGRLGELRRLGDVDWFIFISTNAVEFGVPLINAANIDLTAARVASMGAATSRSLKRHGIGVSLECPPPVGSDSLLGTAPMRQVRGQRVVIVRGVGGRELLRERLTERGASVSYIECYRRSCPQSDPAVLSRARADGRLDIIVTTSVDGLSNLMQLVAESGEDELLNTNLLVAGARQAEEARLKGWKGRIHMAEDASDPAIMKKLQVLARR